MNAKLIKTLHLLRSEPDETVRTITDIISADTITTVVSLYDNKVDWSLLVDRIFENDRVICWW